VIYAKRLRMVWVFFLLALPGVLYLIMQLRISYSWVTYPTADLLEASTSGTLEVKTKVSVIIAARNEANNINRCITSLKAQHYPAELLEIIVIDDHSTDQTWDVIAKYEGDIVRVLRLPDGITGKKEAIKFGLTVAQGSVILFTDADCEVPPRWAKTMVGHLLKEEATMVCGPVSTDPLSAGWLAEFQQIDFAGMMAITAVAIKEEAFVLANGANLGVSHTFIKSVEIDWDMKHASGDDITLATHVFNKGGKVSFVKSTDALVSTSPCESWKDFINQRIRWGTKNKSTPQRKMLIPLGIAYSTSLLSALFLLMLILSLLGFNHAYPTYFILPFILKVLGDLMLGGGIYPFFNLKASPLEVLLYSLIHSVYIAFVGTLSLFVKHYRWKGRKVA